MTVRDVMSKAPSTDSAPATNDDSTERYARLLSLYTELERELDALEHEGRVVREEIQKAIDRDKMKNILQSILAQPAR